MSDPALEMADIESGSDLGSDQDTSSTGEPRYTPQELGAIFLDFYRFLATLHFQAADLKVPPATGWPHMTPELCAHFKCDFLIEVLRHLPYFTHRRNQVAAIHYKSHLIDYSAWTAQDFLKGDQAASQIEFHDDSGDVIDPDSLLAFAQGRETNGRYLWLVSPGACVIEEAVRADYVMEGNIEEYFDRLQQDLQALKLIPCLGRTTIVAHDVPETSQEITKQQVYNQAEDWGTHLDVQYLRKVYRENGWPKAFQEAATRRAVDELLASMPESRGTWGQDAYWYT